MQSLRSGRPRKLLALLSGLVVYVSTDDIFDSGLDCVQVWLPFVFLTVNLLPISLSSSNGKAIKQVCHFGQTTRVCSQDRIFALYKIIHLEPTGKHTNHCFRVICCMDASDAQVDFANYSLRETNDSR